ncbi:ABC transporter substrate-binding protein [Chelatococcus asaccharovorans]|uniref:Amino acid ABC transporter substrate-binding protein (PAAT family) n=1 Tax=Chelatococcus asaccharovorans TaxID=28210 RepID=A0A2V3U550_9HYPH|nr:ABC transporter substrate-binding protein [Chelatococcus asaccharovorans]MBS7703785.1 ABC transporter substrate-binding protein [Chelatococcus asaccharovorans]PXW57945.1 amino acid ABC transporter substrate-binding protein (PAAT family) [Chelatococcus asaccharovorans]
MLSRRSLTLLLASGFAAFSVAAKAADFDFTPEQKGRPHVGVNQKAVDALPKDYKFVRDGYLTVATSPFGAPIVVLATDTRTPVGADPDIATLIAESLGLKLDFLPVAWPDWPLGLTSGKYDAVISNVGVTEARKEKFDFSTYRLGLHGFYVRADSPFTAIGKPEDVAGLKIITGSGTNQEKILLEWDKRNKAAGLRPLELQYYDDQSSNVLALLSGRADAIFNANGPLAYEAAKNGKIRLVGTVNAGWPLKSDVGVTTRKGSGLAPAITIAIDDLIKSGVYADVLKRWGVQAEALEVSETNPPGLPKF